MAISISFSRLPKSSIDAYIRMPKYLADNILEKRNLLSDAEFLMYLEQEIREWQKKAYLFEKNRHNQRLSGLSPETEAYISEIERHEKTKESLSYSCTLWHACARILFTENQKKGKAE